MNKIVIFIILVGVVLGYLYFQNDQPAKQNEQNYQFTQQKTQLNEVSVENKSKCQKDGQQFYDKKKSEEVFEGSVVYTVFENQSYDFNQSLNTCLVAWEDSKLYRGQDGFDIHIRHITDIYSNNDVYSWWQKTLSPFNNPPVDYTGNEVEYNQKLQYYGLY